jgi:hypothetical protein
MQQTAALIASARVAFLLAGALALSRSTVGGAVLIAVACLSWGISVALGACLCRAGELRARGPEGDPYLAEVRGEQLAGRRSPRVTSSTREPGMTRARRGHGGWRSG